MRVRLDEDDGFERALVPALAATKELDRVTEVVFDGYVSYSIYPAIDLPHLQALLASPHWRRLNRLELTFNEMDDAAATFLTSCLNLDRLVYLDLSHNHFTAPGAELLLTSTRLPRLKRLFFEGNDLSPEEQANLTARFGGRICFLQADEG